MTARFQRLNIDLESAARCRSHHGVTGNACTAVRASPGVPHHPAAAQRRRQQARSPLVLAGDAIPGRGQEGAVGLIMEVSFALLDLSIPGGSLRVAEVTSNSRPNVAL